MSPELGAGPGSVSLGKDADRGPSGALTGQISPSCCLCVPEAAALAADDKFR